MGVLKSSRRMIQAERRRHDLAGGLIAEQAYSEKVLGYGPIAYWPLWETIGTVAACQVNAAQNGTYNSDVSLWPPGTGMGDGNTAPFFDGTNDAIDIHSAALQAAFDGDEGTLMAWARVVNVGAWTDGVVREVVHCPHTDWSNYISITKENANNRMRGRRTANGGAVTLDKNGLTSTAWVCYALTWTQSGNALTFYHAGANPVAGAGLNAWVGATLNVNLNSIGANNHTVPNGPYHGWIAHCALWGSALNAVVIADLATV